MYKFNGKRALVTGASRGIGYAILMGLARCNAEVVGLARNVDSLIQAKKDNPDLKIQAVSCDLSDWDTTRSTVNSLGSFDFLVNNVGTNIREPFLDVKSESFDILMNLNLKSVLNVSQIIAKKMVDEKKEGSIVHISSQTSKRSAPNMSIYTSTKAALDGLCRSMAVELGEHRIRVNCVNPTVVITELTREYYSQEGRMQRILDRLPLKRLGEPEDIVGGVLFLLSDDSKMITGATLPIDGGFWTG